MKDPALEIRKPRSVEDFVHGGGRRTGLSVVEDVAVAVAAKAVQAPAVESSTEPTPLPARDSKRPERAENAPRVRGLAERRRGEDKARLTVYVSLDAAAKLRRYCFEKGIDISGEVAMAVEEHVRKLL
jgi:hypothetical protein